nr:hypothetical protein [Tanacetum cinerariifolium]
HGVFGLAKLRFALVVDVAHAAPRGVAHLLPLVFGHAQLGRALLKLHRVAAGGHGRIDKLLGNVERAVVVDANLGNDVARLAGANGAKSNLTAQRSGGFEPLPRTDEVA